MTGVLHVAVVMKPTDGNFASNALRHGVSGLNIDGIRIATSETLQAGSGGLLSNVRDAKDYPNDPGFKQNPAGRWPANVVLYHSPICKCLGVRRVRGNPHLGQKNPDLTIQYGGGCFGGGRVNPMGGYADPDGKEAVENWDCAPECPILLLGEQSGEMKTGDHKKGDSGAASRYFKQVSEFKE